MTKRVLVADDDPGISDAVSLILREAGYEVTTTPHGRTVLELDGDLPDLILLDLHMPDIDGRDVCKQLKARARTRRIPVIMVSANKDTPAIATDAGAEAFVLKPFEMSHVLAIVEEHIGKSSP